MKKIFITIICLAFSFTLLAQDHKGKSSFKTLPMSQFYSLNWQMTQSIESNPFINNFSVNGFDFNFGVFVTDNLSVGLDLSWSYNTKAEPAKLIRPSNNAAIYAAEYKTQQMIPMKAQVKYFFNPRSLVKLYVGAGIGAMYYNYETSIIDMSVYDNTWGFLASPEVGALIPFGKYNNWGANVSVAYNYATNSFATLEVSNNGLHNMVFNVGFYFSL